jgi:hypothetical protein
LLLVSRNYSSASCTRSANKSIRGSIRARRARVSSSPAQSAPCFNAVKTNELRSSSWRTNTNSGRRRGGMPVGLFGRGLFRRILRPTTALSGSCSGAHPWPAQRARARTATATDANIHVGHRLVVFKCGRRWRRRFDYRALLSVRQVGASPIAGARFLSMPAASRSKIILEGSGTEAPIRCWGN